MLDRYEEEAGEAGEGGEGAPSGISISVCVNTTGAEEHPQPARTSGLLSVGDRRLPHQR